MAGGGLTIQPSFAEDLIYPAYQDRLLMKSLGVQAGVVESEDFKISAGTGLQVNVKKGKAFVEQTKAIEESSNTFYNGLYNVLNPIEQNPYNNVEVSAVNPQIAQIIIRVYDIGELKIGGSSYARIEWLNGSPNALATEAKMKEGVYEGRAALPQSSLRIANVLVPKNATKSSEYYIEDARLICIKSNPNFIKIKENYTAKSGDFVLAEKEGSIIILPQPIQNSIIGIWAEVENITLFCYSGKIKGDYIEEGKAEVKLTKGQHAILQANGENWLVISGSVKRGATYTELNVTRELHIVGESGRYIPSTQRDTLVTITLLNTEVSWEATIQVNTGTIGTVKGLANNTVVATFYVPAGQNWSVTKGVQTPTLTSSYMIL